MTRIFITFVLLCLLIGIGLNNRIRGLNEKESNNQGHIIDEKILFEGNKTKANKFYKKNGGVKAGLRIGYLLDC